MKIDNIIKALEDNRVNYELERKNECEIEGFSSIYHYRPNTITWIRHEEILDQVNAPEIGLACIITDHSVENISYANCHIKTSDPRDAFFKIVDTFWGEHEDASISPMAVIEDGACIGQNVSIGAYSFISKNTKVGDNCRIGNNVVIKGKVSIGNNTIIQSNTVIGEQGFAFIWDEGRKHIEHYGGVTIGSDVHIGSGCCVVRGTIDDTVIEDKVKIDNLCHIAHNVVIGANSVIIPGTVLMGSVQIGHDTWVSSALVRDQIKIGNHCTVGMGAAVTKNVDDDTTVVGIPAKPIGKNMNII